MATTRSFKLYHAAATDGVAYIDLPAGGTLAGIRISCQLLAGAGGPGSWLPEVSRAPVNQYTVNNPRGVLATLAVATPAASQGAHANIFFPLAEPVRIGDRIYVNCAAASNFASGSVAVMLDIV